MTKEAMLLLAGKTKGTINDLPKYLEWSTEVGFIPSTPTERLPGYWIWDKYYWLTCDLHAQIAKLMIHYDYPDITLYVHEQPKRIWSDKVKVRGLYSEEDEEVWVNIPCSEYSKMIDRCPQQGWIEASHVKRGSKSYKFVEDTTWSASV